MSTTRGGHKLSSVDRAEIARLYTTPLSDGTWMGATTIARRFNVSVQAIYYVLRVGGVPTRNQAESHAGGKRCKPITNLPVGDAPPCACGCAATTAWNQRKGSWNRYAEGHYRQDAPYKHEVWLREQYETANRTTGDIASECGVTRNTIRKAMIGFGIERRGRSASRRGRMVGVKNPAWKGGVAQWDYSSDWKAIARLIRDRDEWTCQDCGEQRGRWGHHLHVHHKDENKSNNDPANLVSLCATCHRAAHRKEVMA